jgi:hypothetical protein
MPQPVTTITSELTRRLRSENGLNTSIGALTVPGEISLPSIPEGSVIETQVAAEIAEKATGVKYPVVHVYCDRAVNSGREKFRTFSGTADLNIEIRVSHDHIEELHSQLQLYVEAITDVLDRNRGKWSDGAYFPGGYEIQFGPIKRGGRNFLQSAKVRLEIHINMI